MGDRYLTELAEVMRRTGFPVVEVDDWEERARGSGGFNPGKPDHVMVHHTASGKGSDGSSDVNYICFGDDDAPLANLYLQRNGTWHICAGGATNTNGSGDCAHLSPDTMNSSAIGIEAANDGVGEPWPQAMQDSYVAGVRVLCDAYAIPVDRVHGHAEWAPSRKIDPAGPSKWASGSATWNMHAFRDDVVVGGGTVPPPQTQKGNVDMYVIAVKPPEGSGWPGPVDLVVDSVNTRWNRNGNTSSLDKLAGVPRLEVDKDQTLGLLLDRPGIGDNPFVGEYADDDLAW